jgi:hypothetical protein
LIQKVNRPTHLTLLKSKRSENDPGSSSGSGLFYGGEHQKEPGSEKKDPAPPSLESIEPKDEKPIPHPVSEFEKAGMTAVVQELFEMRKETENAEPARPGLAVKYTNDASPAKGLLLNRKAE